MNKENLLEHIRLAINPEYTNWVLFKNGTYIIFDSIADIDNVDAAAVDMMRKFGPVFVGGAAGDFEVIHLDHTPGWVVAGHGYGMYTYVHPSELDIAEPDDVTIGLLGRTKRDSDGKSPEIIYRNSN